MSSSRPIIIAVIVSSLVVVGGGVTWAAVAGSAGSTTEAGSTPTTATESTETGSSATEEEASGVSEGDETTGAAAATSGAYVDWSDGIIEATAGAKVLFFHATWCPKCRQLDEELLAQGAPDGLTVIKVDFDSQTDLRQRYGVTLQTTVVYVDDAGEGLGLTVLSGDPSIASLVAAAP